MRCVAAGVFATAASYLPTNLAPPPPPPVLRGFAPCLVGGTALQLLYYWYRMRPVSKFRSYMDNPNLEAGLAAAATSGSGTVATKDLRRVHKFKSAGMGGRRGGGRGGGGGEAGEVPRAQLQVGIPTPSHPRSPIQKIYMQCQP